MVKKIIIVSIVLAIFASTWAAAETSVWKAQKGNSIIYLGGTCHVLRETDFPLPPEFEEAYRAAKIVVFETDLGKLQDPATQQRLLKKSMYADGSTIDQHLSAQAYARLSAYCEANSIPLNALRQFKPAMVIMTLTFMELMKSGVSQEGVDRHYYERAIKDKKIVKGLETVDEQIDYVVSMADGNEDEFVTYSIRDLKTLKQKYATLVHAWRTGDSKKLEELMVTEIQAGSPELYKKLLTDRNRNWLPMIDAFGRTPQREFVLVGVAHLAGPDGIIEALRKKGYLIEKL